MSLILIFVLIVIPIIHGHEDPKEIEQWFYKVRHHKEKVTRMHFYFHDIPHGSSPTSARVAHADITMSSPNFFGMVNMMDYPITVEPSLSSELVGRAQGFYASASMEIWDVYMSMNIVFPTTGKYNGSSIAIQGHNPTQNAFRELAIVGGSGAFLLARGVVILKTHKYDLTSGNTTIEVDVVAIHH